MRTFIFPLLGFILCTCLACKTKTGLTNEKSLKRSDNGDVNESHGKIVIKSNSLVKVLSTNWESQNLKPADVIYSKCMEWRLSNESIVAILKHGKPISMRDFHYFYYVLPCEVKGLVQIDSSQYSYRINAGSFFTISNRDTTLYFGCNSPEFKDKFLMEGDNPDTDQGL